MIGVWYKETPDSEWVKFTDSYDIYDALNWVQILRSLLNPKAAVKYF